MEHNNNKAGSVPPAIGNSHPEEENPAGGVGNQASPPRMATGRRNDGRRNGGAEEAPEQPIGPFARRGLTRTPPATRSLSAPGMDPAHPPADKPRNYNSSEEDDEEQSGRKHGKRKPTSPAYTTSDDLKKPKSLAATTGKTSKLSEIERKSLSQLDKICTMFARVNIEDPRYKNVMIDIKSLVKEAKAWTEVVIPVIKTALHDLKTHAIDNLEAMLTSSETIISMTRCQEEDRTRLEQCKETILSRDTEIKELKTKLAEIAADNKKLHEGELIADLTAKLKQATQELEVLREASNPPGSESPPAEQQRVAELEEKLRKAMEEVQILRENPEQRKTRLERERILATREKILRVNNGEDDALSLLDEEWPKGAYLRTRIVNKGIVQTSIPKVVLLTEEEKEGEREILQKLGMSFPAVNKYIEEGGPKLGAGQIAIIKTQDSVALMSEETDDGDHTEEPPPPRTLVIGKTKGHSLEELFLMTTKLFRIIQTTVTALEERGEESCKIMYTFPTGVELTKARKIVEVAHAKANCVGELFARDRKQRSCKDKTALINNQEEERRRPRKKRDNAATNGRTSTLVIENKEGCLYSDKVKALQEKVNPGDIGGVVIQTTTKAKDSEDIVLVVKETQAGGREALMNKIRDAAAMKVVAKTRPIRANLIIRNVDPSASRDKAEAELRKLLRREKHIDLEVDEPRLNYAGSLNIAVRADPKSTETLLTAGRVNLGWGRCTIHEAAKPVLCNGCLKPGHIAANCSEKRHQEERLCFNCGKTGHLAKACENTRCCPLCKKEDHGMRSMACEVYRRYTAELRTSRATARRGGQVAAEASLKERQHMEEGGFTYVASGVKPSQKEAAASRAEEEEALMITQNDPEAQVDTTNQPE